MRVYLNRPANDDRITRITHLWTLLAIFLGLAVVLSAGWLK
jgi:hypothetical protein